MTEQNTVTFESMLLSYAQQRHVPTVFKDFVDIVISVFCYRSEHGMPPPSSELDQNILSRYQDDDVLLWFMRILRQLTNDMDKRKEQAQNPDLLGEFYQQHVAGPTERSIFHAWDGIDLTIRSVDAMGFNPNRPQGMFDTRCKSGRKLMAMTEKFGTDNVYLGMDDNPLFVKMAALNLFLGTDGRGEVACIQPGTPQKFILAYRYSQIPLSLEPVSPIRSVVWTYLKP